MSFTEGLHFIFLTTGFAVGFGHCIGMCGPVIVSISLNLRTTSIWSQNLLYHSGRVTTYAILGGIMGATGTFTRVSAGIAGLQKGVLILTGLMIVAMGMGMAMGGRVPLGRIFGDHYNPDGAFSRGFKKLTGARSAAAYFPLGLLLGLLPCGPVYTALIAAARAGMEAPNTVNGIVSGMGLMVAFGLGTVPSLLLVARLTGMDWLRSRGAIYRAGSVLMIAVGVYFVIRGARY